MCKTSNTMFKPKKGIKIKEEKKISSHGSEDNMITDESISEAYQLLHQCAQPQQPVTRDRFIHRFWTIHRLPNYENMII